MNESDLEYTLSTWTYGYTDQVPNSFVVIFLLKGLNLWINVYECHDYYNKVITDCTDIWVSLFAKQMDHSTYSQNYSFEFLKPDKKLFATCCKLFSNFFTKICTIIRGDLVSVTIMLIWSWRAWTYFYLLWCTLVDMFKMMCTLDNLVKGKD